MFEKQHCLFAGSIVVGNVNVVAAVKSAMRDRCLENWRCKVKKRES